MNTETQNQNETNDSMAKRPVERLVMRIWPFGKKEPEIDKFLISQRALEEKIFNAYPLFSEFEYMGVTCRVTYHQHYIRGIRDPRFHLPGRSSKVYCTYVDKKGEIHDVSFRLEELEALLDA
jgi:hypothetical protein